MTSLTWTDLLPAITGLIYLASSAGYAVEGQKGLSIAYIAYALANVGLVMAAVEGRR